MSRWIYFFCFVVSTFIGGFVVAALSSSPSQKLKCTGGLPVFAVNSEKVTFVNRDKQGFTLGIKQASYIFVGANVRTRYIEVFPWLGLQELKHEENYKSNFDISYKTDRHTTFSISVTGKRSGFAESIECQLVR